MSFINLQSVNPSNKRIADVRVNESAVNYFFEAQGGTHARCGTRHRGNLAVLAGVVPALSGTDMCTLFGLRCHPSNLVELCDH